MAAALTARQAPGNARADVVPNTHSTCWLWSEVGEGYGGKSKSAEVRACQIWWMHYTGIAESGRAEGGVRVGTAPLELKGIRVRF